MVEYMFHIEKIKENKYSACIDYSNWKEFLSKILVLDPIVLQLTKQLNVLVIIKPYFLHQEYITAQITTLNLI